MPATRPSRRRRRRLAIGAASLAFHGLLGWVLLKAVPAPPVLVEPRSVVVQLLAPARPRPAERPAASRAQSAPLHLPTPRPAPPPPVSPVAPSPLPAAPGTIVAPPGFTARGTLTGGGEALRQAARRSACTEADIVKLTKAERDACAEALGAKHKNGPALYAAIDPDKKAAFDGDCKKDDDWCLYRAGKGPYPGLFALGRKKKIKGWD
ncbi:hypothetical protein [Caulobacter sp. UNC279MFTsu5.1]|uniref:hypothetical protein n=1 Tax=Caulobacter sp. UNC279MFTsu5.1 TaxID=1502775 RepID=UPI00036AD4A4|nr:hypothetical protein [Caulobacter sp. UNC279MFTsu5.1]SFJ92500.1 hypothetical protein SAMN02799626_02928 [Caulobacter sp. UNC279MFTsu5.1]